MAREREDPSLEVPIELSTTGEFVLPPTLSVEPLGRIGRYDVLGRMAVGGMAEIYLAREDATAGATRYIILKVIRPQLADDTDFGQMFLNEGRVALALKHPNICHVYEFGVDGMRYFIAMEYVHGATLRAALRRTREQGTLLPVPIAVRVIAHVAEALESAHTTRSPSGRVGIIHRDVTPQNIMIGFDGVVKLLDFGIARPQSETGRDGLHRLEGKIAYMAPEQLRGRPVDKRADIFSLGVCMWEVLTGRPLFKRDKDLDTLKAVLEEPVPHPASLGVTLPPKLVPVMLRALAKDPDKRWQSAGDMERALQEYLLEARELVNTQRIAQMASSLFAEEIKKGPVLDRGEQVVDRLKAGEIKAAPAAVEPAPPKARRSRWLPLTLAALVAAGGAAFVFFGDGLLSGAGGEVDGRTVRGDTTQSEPPLPPSVATLPGADEEDAGAGALPLGPTAEASDEASPPAEAEAEGEVDEEPGESRRRKRRRIKTQDGFLVEPDF